MRVVEVEQHLGGDTGELAQRRRDLHLVVRDLKASVKVHSAKAWIVIVVLQRCFQVLQNIAPLSAL